MGYLILYRFLLLSLEENKRQLDAETRLSLKSARPWLCPARKSG